MPRSGTPSCCGLLRGRWNLRYWRSLIKWQNQIQNRWKLSGSSAKAGFNFHFTFAELPLHLILILLLLVQGCASKRILPENAGAILNHEDPRVGTYVSSERGFETSSYWIEGPTGLVLIDTQFLLSAGDEALAWAEKATGKKVVLAIVLHPNPDKFNGTNHLKARGIPVVTSEQVRALIPEVHKDRHHWFYDRFKPDYPDEVPLPDSFGDKTRELDVAGLKLIARVLGGPGCSGAHVAVEWDRHLFTGDLVTNLNHSWLEIGEVDAWLERMHELQSLQPKAVHPGRGPSGG